MDALDRLDALTQIRDLLDGKTLRAPEDVAPEVLDGLEAAGWIVTRAPAPPMRRLVLTVMPDGTPIETIELQPPGPLPGVE
jgi:hypothetical protein